MVRVMILEDDSAQAEILQQYLFRYQQQYPGTDFAVNSYASGAGLLAAYRSSADLLLMDIQMEGINGIETAKRIRLKDEKVLIVFVTSIAAYAVEGYSVEAFDYVLKPLSYAMFEAKMNRVLRVLEERDAEVCIDIRTKTESIRVSADSITYIEVAGHEVTVHTTEKAYSHWGSLSDCEAQLPREKFARCNACYLVNLAHVRRIGIDTVLVGNDELSVSKTKRRDFLQALAAWKGRQ